jgi:transaldolase
MRRDQAGLVSGRGQGERNGTDDPGTGARRRGNLAGGAPSYVSVFAGRVADTGRDPVPLMAASVETLRPFPQSELVWASPRQLLNVFQADAIGCHIITVTHDVLKKLALVGKHLDQYSLETVQMFRSDAVAAGFSLESEDS